MKKGSRATKKGSRVKKTTSTARKTGGVWWWQKEPEPVQVNPDDNPGSVNTTSERNLLQQSLDKVDNTIIHQAKCKQIITEFLNKQRANLSDLDLHKAVFPDEFDLEGIDLTYSNLAGSTLISAKLMGANLTGANLTGAKLMGANLMGANLTGAKLMGAIMTDANMTRAIMTDANMTRAELMGVKGLNDTIDLDNTIGLYTIKTDINLMSRFGV